MKWFLKVLKQDAAFSGRSRRREYWMFALFYFVFALVMFILDSILIALLSWYNFPYIVAYYISAMIIPWITVSVRRMHDLGYSGWMILIYLIPIIGTIWYYILMLRDGDPSSNKYGINPKQLNQSI